MPTGYTAPLYEGKDISFEEFMLRCSRAWGATILLRDHDADVLPTEDNVSEDDYAARWLVEAQAEYARVRDLNDDEIAAEHSAEIERTLRSNDEGAVRCEELRERYEAMLARVEAWEPPSEDHVSFKEFVAKQLRDSIDFDARPYSMPVKTLTDAQWQAARMERLGEKIERYHEEVTKAAERNMARQRWIRELRESLEGVTA